MDGPIGSAEPRFVVDVMLGRLVRWLRMLGYDTVYDPRADDAAIARLAARDGRIVLTRDRGLLRRRLVREGLLVDHDDVGAQLRIVVDALALDIAPERRFRRCLVCNAPLAEARPDEVAGRVPPFVLRTHAAFRACTGCGRVYWPGTHVADARARLDAWLA